MTDKKANSRCARASRSPFVSVGHRHHVVSSDVAREPLIDALMEKHPHDSFTVIRGGLLEERNDLLALDGREAREEGIDCLATFEIVDECLDRNAWTCKDRVPLKMSGAAVTIGVAMGLTLLRFGRSAQAAEV